MLTSRRSVIIGGRRSPAERSWRAMASSPDPGGRGGGPLPVAPYHRHDEKRRRFRTGHPGGTHRIVRRADDDLWLFRSDPRPGRAGAERAGGEPVISNRLPVESSVHWHGLFVPSDVDGPSTRSHRASHGRLELRIAQPAATTWYHPHPHGDTHARPTWASRSPLCRRWQCRSLQPAREHGVDDICRSSCRTGSSRPTAS